MQLFHHYAQQLSSICAPVKPMPVTGAQVSMVNQAFLQELGLDPADFSSHTLLTSIFDGQGQLQQHSVAQKYGGHQFGQWNPHLGDGRGLLLGEIKTPDGALIDLHLKGAGPTPYSRHADGRAVLRSTIREYLGAEALHHLGIKSSRSLCLISSNEPVIRETRERGAMMIRCCPSHIRFGHFEYFYHTQQNQALEDLFNFCFEHHFVAQSRADNPHLALLQEIVNSTAHMIAKWQAYGFNHGVMNTDNMSIHGITFDYGPYAFLDDFISHNICNRSDHNGRYAFDQQPGIGLWNLNALAHAFSQHLSVEQITTVLQGYEPEFISTYTHLMRVRLGFPEIIEDEDLSNKVSVCVNRWLNILEAERADFHIPFRLLSEHLLELADGNYQLLSDQLIDASAVKAWCDEYTTLQQMLIDSSSAKSQNWAAIQHTMLATNPKFVLRNHLLQKAIEAAEEDDFSICEQLFDALQKPFQGSLDSEHLYCAPNDENKGIALSCSS